MNSFETEKQLIEIIRAALHGQKVNTDSLSNEIGNLARRNKVFNLLYLGTGNERAKKKYKEFLIQQTEQQSVLLRMEALFEESGVFLMPIKGAQTKKRYPKPELRSMNDIDVLCKSAQHRQVREAMERLGYDEYRQGRKHDAYYFAPHVTVEVHYDLADGEFQNYYTYYQNIWDKAMPKNECRYIYEMCLEDEYIFNLVHLAIHFLEGGAGMRFFADIYVYEGLAFDRAYVQNELKTLGLFEFYQNCAALAFSLFGSERQRCAVTLTPVLEQMREYVLQGGLFGDRARVRDMNANKGKLATLTHHLFPNYHSMKSMFPWLKPALLPAAWGLRMVRAAHSRKENVKIALDSTTAGNKDSGAALEQFYKQCGL